MYLFMADYFPLPSSWGAVRSEQYSSLIELQTVSSEYQIVANMFKPGTKKIQKVSTIP